jgi:Zn-dependent peptidase ImmA (M78 family)
MDHPVHDECGEAVFGVCEHDPQEPAAVMISLNAELLGDQPELLRSTAAHELGHAVFDMPAAMAKGTARAFRSRAEVRAPEAPIDWREWRADEFMGAFLTPRRQLTRAFTREAAAYDLPLRWRGGEIPAPWLSANVVGWGVIDGIAGALAEQFGVSESFIGVRLRKYGLVSIKE